uniref:Pyroglutamyl-peptidase I n=1 Tax=Clastoptera arizonana TaxID=38151 RepID=A0A1B6CD28_9HEMI
MATQCAEPEFQIYSEPKRVLVTGFAPFDIHKVNASWESVKLLKESDLEKDLNVELVIEEIPVVYDVVEETIPSLWRKHNPLKNVQHALVTRGWMKNRQYQAVEKVVYVL